MGPSPLQMKLIAIGHGVPDGSMRAGKITPLSPIVYELSDRHGQEQ
jgi:hypothetical protein